MKDLNESKSRVEKALSTIAELKKQSQINKTVAACKAECARDYKIATKCFARFSADYEYSDIVNENRNLKRKRIKRRAGRTAAKSPDSLRRVNDQKKLNGGNGRVAGNWRYTSFY